MKRESIISLPAITFELSTNERVLDESQMKRESIVHSPSAPFPSWKVIK